MKKKPTVTDYINQKNILIAIGVILFLSLIGQGILFYKINKLNKAVILTNTNTKVNFEMTGKLLNFTCALTGDVETCGQQWENFVTK